jgi:hypothetical protein
MAFELYEMLAGNVNPVIGEHIKPAYGGGDEAFLQKVVTPIYNTIAKVCTYKFSIMCFCLTSCPSLFFFLNNCTGS